MQLAPGTRLGAYEITAALGVGGMGEVFRARDTRLQRDVAIKVLPALFAADPERLARFEREATTLASLNHPNIAQIHGLEETKGVRALVMELVEGETLAERIARGPVPIDETLPIARQIADALEAAHDCNIIHRDLKPANIKVRTDGTVKVLDFGLAKALEPSPAVQGSAEALRRSPMALPNSPTFASPEVTRAGVILGTAAYMSPEQARGRPVDARADIWAFGVTLYEMVTGRQLFTGATVSDVLASILRDGPDWDALPSNTPHSLRTLLRRCLQKDPQLRLRHAGDARLELMDADVNAAAAPGARSRFAWTAALTGGAVVAAALFAVGAYWIGRPKSSDLPVRKWIIPQQAGDNLFGRENIPAISPDGRRVAYTDGRHLRIRELATLESVEIQGDDVAGMPTWSPDGRALAYFVGHKSIWQVPAAGGSPAKICELPPGVVFGIAWRPNGTILVNMAYGPRGGEVFRVSERGGRPEKMALAGAPRSDTPVFHLRGLPDGSVIYQTVDGTRYRTVLENEGRQPKVIEIPGHAGVTYAASGHLLYTSREVSGVWAAPFDISSGSVTGEPFRVAESGIGPNAAADGTLAYGHMTPGSRQLTWVDRDGAVRETFGQPQDDIQSPAISPDGTRVAVAGTDKGVTNVWVHEMSRPVRSRVTFGSTDVDPAWHPTDGRIVYQSGNWDVMVATADGGTQPTALLSKPIPEFQALWSRDGRHLVYGEYLPKNQGDIWTIEGGGAPRAVVAGPFAEMSPTLSPDGRFIAYVSDETGRNEVFVRSFPAGEGKRQVSSNGGMWPKWRGSEIFFVEKTMLMSAAVRTQAALQFDAPKPLFKLEDRAAAFPIYDTTDGKRFVVARTLKPPQNGIAIVQNWLAEFRK